MSAITARPTGTPPVKISNCAINAPYSAPTTAHVLNGAAPNLNDNATAMNTACVISDGAKKTVPLKCDNP